MKGILYALAAFTISIAAVVLCVLLFANAIKALAKKYVSILFFPSPRYITSTAGFFALVVEPIMLIPVDLPQVCSGIGILFLTPVVC